MGNLSWAFEKADSQCEQIFKCRQSLRCDEFHGRIGNLFPNSQSKNKDALWTLKGCHRMGDGPIFLNTSAPHSLMTTYRINLLSARSISLDSTFNQLGGKTEGVIFSEFWQKSDNNKTFSKYSRRKTAIISGFNFIKLQNCREIYMYAKERGFAFKLCSTLYLKIKYQIFSEKSLNIFQLNILSPLLIKAIFSFYPEVNFFVRSIDNINVHFYLPFNTIISTIFKNNVY